MGVDAGLDSTGHDAEGCNSAGAAGNGETRHGPATSRARGLAQDWITLWQSELSAMAADPEMRETWQTMMALWAGTMAASLRAMPRDWPPHGPSGRHDQTARGAGTADAPRATPAAAAPDARDAEIERLARHVAALERRLADIERGGDPPVNPKRRPRRKP
jgi:hypothetical protein